MTQISVGSACHGRERTWAVYGLPVSTWSSDGKHVDTSFNSSTAIPANSCAATIRADLQYEQAVRPAWYCLPSAGMKQETKHSHAAASTPASGHWIISQPETPIPWDFLSHSTFELRGCTQNEVQSFQGDQSTLARTSWAYKTTLVYEMATYFQLPMKWCKFNRLDITVRHFWKQQSMCGL